VSFPEAKTGPQLNAKARITVKKIRGFFMALKYSVKVIYPLKGRIFA
jgi:hypothetical protein